MIRTASSPSSSSSYTRLMKADLVGLLNGARDSFAQAYANIKEALMRQGVSEQEAISTTISVLMQASIASLIDIPDQKNPWES